MKKSKSPYYGFRFPAAVISCAVRWYYRFNLSLREVEELLLERGVSVTYETVRNWCDRLCQLVETEAERRQEKASLRTRRTDFG